jgi:DNA-binding transcriptional regulator YiaG
MTGQELRKLRATTGLTQEQFALMVLGVTSGTVARWERGNNPIDDLKAEGIRTRVKEYLAKQSRK